MYQLPDDVKAAGYKKTSGFEFEQVFYSAGHKFTGTEKEFEEKGFAYQYTQIDKHTRRIIN